jgi:hypothetical protein
VELNGGHGGGFCGDFSSEVGACVSGWCCSVVSGGAKSDTASDVLPFLWPSWVQDGLRNPWNMDQTFRDSAPDGQPIPPKLGARICDCMDAASRAAGKRPPKRMVAPGLEGGGKERERSRPRSRSRSPGRQRERSRSPPSVLDMSYKVAPFPR